MPKKKRSSKPHIEAAIQEARKRGIAIRRKIESSRRAKTRSMVDKAIAQGIVRPQQVGRAARSATRSAGASRRGKAAKRTERASLRHAGAAKKREHHKARATAAAKAERAAKAAATRKRNLTAARALQATTRERIKSGALKQLSDSDIMAINKKWAAVRSAKTPSRANRVIDYFDAVAVPAGKEGRVTTTAIVKYDKPKRPRRAKVAKKKVAKKVAKKRVSKKVAKKKVTILKTDTGKNALAAYRTLYQHYRSKGLDHKHAQAQASADIKKSKDLAKKPAAKPSKKVAKKKVAKKKTSKKVAKKTTKKVAKKTTARGSSKGVFGKHGFPYRASKEQTYSGFDTDYTLGRTMGVRAADVGGKANVGRRGRQLARGTIRAATTTSDRVTAADIIREANEENLKAWVCVGSRYSGCGGGKSTLRGGRTRAHLTPMASKKRRRSK